MSSARGYRALQKKNAQACSLRAMKLIDKGAVHRRRKVGCMRPELASSSSARGKDWIITHPIGTTQGRPIGNGILASSPTR